MPSQKRTRSVKGYDYQKLEFRKMLATISGTNGPDVFQVFDDEIYINDQLYTGTLDGNDTIDGLDGDDLFQIFSTSRDIEYFGNQGNDRFEVRDNNPLADSDAVLEIDPGSGELNELRVYASQLADEGADIDFNRLDSRDDFFEVEGATSGQILLPAESHGAWSLIELNGTSFNDSFNVTFWPLPSKLFVVNGLQGDDSSILNGSTGRHGNPAIPGESIEVYPGEGSDSVFADYDNEDLGGPVTSWNLSVFDNDGSDFEDTATASFLTFTGETVHLDGNINESSGLSTFEVPGSSGVFSYAPSLAQLNIWSDLGHQSGNSRIVVEDVLTDRVGLFSRSNSSFVIHVETIPQIDILGGVLGVTFIGTEGDDVFVKGPADVLTINGSEWPGIRYGHRFQGEGGDDQFFINDTRVRGGGPDEYFGGDGDDGFYIDSGTLTAANDDQYIPIDGGSGSNRLSVIRQTFGTTRAKPVLVRQDEILNVTRTQIRYTATGGSFAGGIRIEGIPNFLHEDVVLVQSLLPENSLVVATGQGDDFVRVEPEVRAKVEIEDESGNDRYVVFLRSDRLQEVPEIRDAAGDGDRLIVFLTGFDDDVELSPSQILVGANSLTLDNLEFLSVFGGGGDDRFTVNGISQTRTVLAGNGGEDTFKVNEVGDGSLLLRGNEGDDQFSFLSSSGEGYLGVLGSEGDDKFDFKAGFSTDVVVNGGEGSDAYDFTQRDEDRQWVSVNDSGTSGEDSVDLSLPGAVPVKVAERGVFSTSQRILQFGIEALSVVGTDFRDLVSLTGSPAKRINISLGDGQDVVEAQATLGIESLRLDLGSGKDYATVLSVDSATEFELSAGDGDDAIFIGGRPNMPEATLDGISGQLSVDLGNGEDLIYVVDLGVEERFGFNSTPSRFENRSEESLRLAFSGFNVVGHERLVFLGSTSQSSLLFAKPSETTSYRFVSTSSDTGSLVLDEEDSGEVDFFGDDSGAVSFEGKLDIEFAGYFPL